MPRIQRISPQLALAHVRLPIFRSCFKIAIGRMASANRLDLGSVCRGHKVLGTNWLFALIPPPFPFPAPSSVPDCPACSWRAVVFSAGGDGGIRRQPDTSCQS